MKWVEARASFSSQQPKWILQQKAAEPAESSPSFDDVLSPIRRVCLAPYYNNLVK